MYQVSLDLSPLVKHLIEYWLVICNHASVLQASVALLSSSHLMLACVCCDVLIVHPTSHSSLSLMLKTSLMATRGDVQRCHPAQAIADEVLGLMHVEWIAIHCKGMSGLRAWFLQMWVMIKT